MRMLNMKKAGILKWWFMLLIVATGNQHDSCIKASGAPDSSILPDSLVSEGNKHYMHREYGLAADCYNEVIDLGYISGDLFYNLGNSYYKQDSLSKAILYYEKALLLKPGDEDIRQNLALANARIIDKIDSIPVFFLRRWISDLQRFFLPAQWAVISLVLFLLALSSFLWFVISSDYNVKRTGFTAGVVFLMLAVSGMLSMCNRTNKLLKSGSAIIMTSSVSAKSSPDEQSTNMFVLHEGTKVMLLDSVQNWKEIRIPDGNKGWVPDAVLEKI
jgi:hypothetical protein